VDTVCGNFRWVHLWYCFDNDMNTACEDCIKLEHLCDACAEAAELRAHAMWQAYCRSGHKPVYVPERPDLMYADVWHGWRDWVAWSEAGAHSSLAARAA